EVTAFDQCGTTESSVQPASRAAQVFLRTEREASESLSLIHIGHHEHCECEQFLQRSAAAGLQETAAACGLHNRVNNQAGTFRLTEEPGYDANDWRGKEHPRLHGRRSQLRKDRFNLAEHHFRTAGLDCAEALRVLSGNASDRARAMNAKGCERLQVGLDTRTAPAVRPCNR